MKQAKKTFSKNSGRMNDEAQQEECWRRVIIECEQVTGE
jgi:hypothetical protein